MEGEPASVQMLELLWGVDVTEMGTMPLDRTLSELIFLHPPLQFLQWETRKYAKILILVAPLITHANNIDTSTTPEAGVIRSDESAEPSAGADEKKPSWKSNTFAMTLASQGLHPLYLSNKLHIGLLLS